MDLRAERIGDQVRLRWSTPNHSTDDLPLRGSVTAVLCRAVLLPPAAESCVPIGREAARPGAGELIDNLPAHLTQGPPQLLLYRVRLLNRSEHAAPPSEPAFAAAGPAPAPLAAFSASSAPDGTLLRWQPTAPAHPIEIHRSTLGPPPGKASTDILLRADPPSISNPFTPDAGATLDPTARPGTGYTYTAQRVRVLTVGGHTLELRSLATAPTTLDLRDTFPPRPPEWLQAVADTTDPTAAAVDLSWHPNPEPDLAGYLVLRQQPGQPAAQLTPSALAAPAFRDTTARPGTPYTYTVVALDRTGNRSLPSPPATATLP